MIACAVALCFLQTPSLIEGKFDATFWDTETGEKLEVVWVSEEVTKNVMGETCWFYNGDTRTDCTTGEELS